MALDPQFPHVRIAGTFDGIRMRSGQCRASSFEQANDHVYVFLRLGVQSIPPLLELIRILNCPLHYLSIGWKQYSVKPMYWSVVRVPLARRLAELIYQVWKTETNALPPSDRRALQG